jgi:hypothetical protein
MAKNRRCRLWMAPKLKDFITSQIQSEEVPRGLMARKLGFHPRGLGSIPGVGDHFFSFFFFAILYISFYS